MLEIRGLSKSFGGVKAADNVTLDFPDGSLTAVIGPNGAGKSTFFNLMTGALKPDAGQILLNDVDMFLYVEQDALVFGDAIVEKTKNALRRRNLVFGSGGLDIQQSFFAANKKGIRHFLSALHAINYSDKQVAPEHKFMFAASRFLPGPLIKLAEFTEVEKLRVAGLRLFSLACALAKNYAFLPFGYGRERPINFGDEVFYFQHGSADELTRYKKRTGF